jgi:hypothetical protein
MIRTTFLAALAVSLAAPQAHADAVVYDQWVDVEVTEPMELEPGMADMQHVLRIIPPLTESARFSVTCTASDGDRADIEAGVNSGRTLLHFGEADALDVTMSSGDIAEQRAIEPMNLRELSARVAPKVYRAFFDSGRIKVDVASPTQRTVFAVDLGPSNRPLSEFIRSCGFSKPGSTEEKPEGTSTGPAA